MGGIDYISPGTPVFIIHEHPEDAGYFSIIEGLVVQVNIKINEELSYSVRDADDVFLAEEDKVFRNYDAAIESLSLIHLSEHGLVKDQKK